MQKNNTKKFKTLWSTGGLLFCLLAFSLLSSLLPTARALEMHSTTIGSSGSIVYSTISTLLVTDSTPEGPVPYKIDENSGYQTGSTYTILTGMHTIELPSPYTSPISNTTYHFSCWQDGPTDNPRNITLTADTTASLHGIYSTPSEPPPTPPPPSEALYSFVHITDTQYLSRDYPDNLNAMFSYLETVKTEYNIKWISFSGDCVQNWGSDYQWNNFLHAASLTTIPIEISAGNHDNDWGTNFYWYNQYVGQDRQYYYTVHEDFICLYISWFGSTNTMDNEVISYFQNALTDNPTKIPLIVTHYYMNVNSSLVSLAYQIHNNDLVRPPVSIVLCGHVHNSFSNTRTVDGTTVYEFMTNYQEQSGYACVRFFTVYEGQFTERVLRVRPEPVSWVTEEKSHSLP